jgi:general secretion pathway protein L
MIGAFLAWWFGQLADLLPQGLRRSLMPHARALVIVPGEPLGGASVVAVWSRRGSRETLVGEFTLGAPGLEELPSSPGQEAVLRLNNEDVLEKTLTLPLAARARLGEALAFEMDRQTPFTPDELYWNYIVDDVDRQHRRLSIRLLLIRKAKLSSLLTALEQAGIVPGSAEIVDETNEYPSLPLDGGRTHPRSRRVTWAISACCAVLFVGAVLTPLLQQAATLTALESQLSIVESTATEAKALQRELDRLSLAADLVKNGLARAGRPLKVVATLTRLLPDDTHLTELQFGHGKVTFSGRSADASRLISLLAHDSYLQNPAFAAPVVRVAASSQEAFTIVVGVEPGS